jgi:hypothetical protein
MNGNEPGRLRPPPEAGQASLWRPLRLVVLCSLMGMSACGGGGDAPPRSGETGQAPAPTVATVRTAGDWQTGRLVTASAPAGLADGTYAATYGSTNLQVQVSSGRLLFLAPAPQGGAAADASIIAAVPGGTLRIETRLLPVPVPTTVQVQAEWESLNQRLQSGLAAVEVELPDAARAQLADLRRRVSESAPVLATLNDAERRLVSAMLRDLYESLDAAGTAQTISAGPVRARPLGASGTGRIEPMARPLDAAGCTGILDRMNAQIFKSQNARATQELAAGTITDDGLRTWVNLVNPLTAFSHLGSLLHELTAGYSQCVDLEGGQAVTAPEGASNGSDTLNAAAEAWQSFKSTIEEGTSTVTGLRATVRLKVREAQIVGNAQSMLQWAQATGISAADSLRSRLSQFFDGAKRLVPAGKLSIQDVSVPDIRLDVVAAGDRALSLVPRFVGPRPAPDAQGRTEPVPVSFKLVTSDGKVVPVTTQVKLIDRPMMSGGSISTPASQTYNGNFEALNFETFEIVTRPANGRAFAPDTRGATDFRYVPDPGFTGRDFFEVRALNGPLASEPVRFEVLVGCGDVLPNMIGWPRLARVTERWSNGFVNGWDYVVSDPVEWVQRVGRYNDAQSVFRDCGGFEPFSMSRVIDLADTSPYQTFTIQVGVLGQELIFIERAVATRPPAGYYTDVTVTSYSYEAVATRRYDMRTGAYSLFYEGGQRVTYVTANGQTVNLSSVASASDSAVVPPLPGPR